MDYKDRLDAVLRPLHRRGPLYEAASLVASLGYMCEAMVSASDTVDFDHEGYNLDSDTENEIRHGETPGNGHDDTKTKDGRLGGARQREREELERQGDHTNDEFRRFTDKHSGISHFVPDATLGAERMDRLDAARDAIVGALDDVPEAIRPKILTAVIQALLHLSRDFDTDSGRTLWGDHGSRQFRARARFAPTEGTVAQVAMMESLASWIRDKLTGGARTKRATVLIRKAVEVILKTFQDLTMPKSGQKVVLRKLLNGLLKRTKTTMKFNTRNWRDQHMPKQVAGFVDKKLKAGKKSISLDLRGAKPGEIKQIIAAYRDALAAHSMRLGGRVGSGGHAFLEFLPG